MSASRVRRAPGALRQHRVRSDNLVVVPASLLPFKEEWQQMANHLPLGDALFVLPPNDSLLRRIMTEAAAQWRSQGRHAAVVNATRINAGHTNRRRGRDA